MLRRCSAAVVLLLAGLALPAHAQVTLAWKLNKGDKFYIRTVTTSKQSIRAAGKEGPKQDVEQTTVLGFTVKDKGSDGSLVLEQTVEAVTYKTGGGEPKADDKVAGSSFTLTLSPKMEILKVEGIDKFIDKQAGEDIDLRKKLQTVVSEEALKMTARMVFAFLPDRPVKEGETWERSIELPLGALGTRRDTRTYKYEGKDDVGGKKVEKISYTAAVDIKNGLPTPALGYHVARGDFKPDEAKGTIHFDASTGRLVQGESRLKGTGKMVLSVAGVNVDCEIQQEQTTRVALLNDNPVNK